MWEFFAHETVTQKFLVRVVLAVAPKDKVIAMKLSPR